MIIKMANREIQEKVENQFQASSAQIVELKVIFSLQLTKF